MKRECHKECEGNPYCCVEARSDFHLRNEAKLIPSDKPPENGMWKDGSYVHKPTALSYCGMAVHLNPDGTYYLEDTTGG